MKDHPRVVALDAIRHLCLYEIEAGASIVIAQQRGQPVAQIETVISARCKTVGCRLPPVPFKPLDEIVRLLRKNAHATGGHIQTVDIELRPIGGSTPEAGIVADDCYRSGGRQQPKKVDRYGDRRKSRTDDSDIVEQERLLMVVTIFPGARTPLCAP
ncbi:antitoxin (DNA-binding transcriptional repressor) of toxin-antitoxin stability system [Sinorhizobium fredii]